MSNNKVQGRAPAMIELIRPMLATLVPKPFHQEGWVYEEKYDGVGALAYRRSQPILARDTEDRE